MNYWDNKTKNIVARLIRENGDVDYDPLISDKDYYCFYYLSSLRRALLEWFPFREGGDALEIGASYGPLTGLYLDHFQRVDALEPDPVTADLLKARYPRENLRVFCEDFSSFDSQGKQYDYIFLIDSQDTFSGDLKSLLAKASSLLRPDGRVLVGFRSRNGIKYSCGALDEYVTDPFCTDALLDPVEFREIARSIFSDVHCYYPFPDHLYTQAVFSEHSLPNESIRDRVLPLDPFDSPLIKEERDEYDRAIQNGVLDRVANFCLYVLGNVPLEDPVVEQAVLSCDRGERSYVTSFLSDGTVKKSAVHEGGKQYLKDSFDALKQLKDRGLKTVFQSWDGDSLWMPWIRDPGLLSRIGSLQKGKDREGILSIFQELYRNILRSSDIDSSGYSPDKWGLPIGEAGDILRTGYIDLIPYNAFCTEEDPLYYDQEFLEEYCPSLYIQFRAIHYTYIHLRDLEELIPQQEMFGQFGIPEKMQDAFQKVEDRFVAQNRNWDLYPQMYRWGYGITKERIDSNRKKLHVPEDPELIDRIHAIQLQVLRKFDAFCKENGLRYFAIHGTLLGAVRHDGFIPWDDDVDIGMPREDYDLLIQKYPRKCDPYLQTMETAGRMFYGGYSKLRDQSSMAVEEFNLFQYGNKGIWIDIFPLDYVSEDETKRAKQKKRITDLQRICYARFYEDRFGLIKDAPSDRISLYYALGKVIPGKVIRWLLERQFHSVRRSSLRSILACYYGERKNRNIYPAADLDDLISLPFEDMEIPVPANYDTWLKERYGEDYMAIPQDKRRKHSNVYIDPDNSFQDYNEGKVKWKI
ncbi:MAG: LicD family protein [Oscillospiraceae bacterium]|nr:LicD family protein [Oscillospiraceae bacterium]